jgi:hypothetical protein
MTDAGIAQITKLGKDDIVIALMGITGSGFVQETASLVCKYFADFKLSLKEEHAHN